MPRNVEKDIPIPDNGFWSITTNGSDDWEIGRSPFLKWVIPADAVNPASPRRAPRINAGKEASHAEEQKKKS